VFFYQKGGAYTGLSLGLYLLYQARKMKEKQGMTDIIQRGFMKCALFSRVCIAFTFLSVV
jgi:hypothetical protein